MNTNGLMYQVSFDGGPWSENKTFTDVQLAEVGRVYFTAAPKDYADLVHRWNNAPLCGQWRYRLIDTAPVIEGAEQPYKPLRRRVYA